MVVLDTSVIIDHLRQAPGKFTYFSEYVNKYPKDKLAISMVTIQEVYEGKSTREESRASALLMILTRIKILPYTFEVAKLAGEIARDSQAKIDIADAAIAATTIINGGQLLTLNKKDFQNIKGLELI